jgi:hypothetical protein
MVMKPVTHRILLALLPLFAGCTSLDLNIADFGREIDRTAGVADIVCLWEPAEGVGMDGLPTRGFAGQILFFVKGQSEPVKVNGDVRIYVFDDQGTEEEQKRPLHEFNFPADAWNIYLSPTNLGTAYQVFVPYTRKGGMQANCALRVRLAATDRMPVFSKLANVALPGRVAPTTTKDTAAPSPLAPGTDAAGPDLEALMKQAAVHRTSPEMGGGASAVRLQRLRQAAESAVQNADYTVNAENETETAHFETEAPVSRRYRMSGTAQSR